MSAASDAAAAWYEDPENRRLRGTPRKRRTRMPEWDNDEGVDYTVRSDHWAAGGGPRGAWPEHDRTGLFCSVCGLVQSQPPVTDLSSLVLAAESHHREKHGGPPRARMSPEDIAMQQLFERQHYGAPE